MQLFEYIDILKQPYDIFYTDSICSPLHWHYYSEIIYITKGSVTITCNNQKKILKEGDLCYIYPLQLHAFSEARDTEVQYAVLKFDIHTINIPQAYISKFYDIFLRRTRETDFCMIIDGKHLNGACIESLIYHTIQEYTEKKDFYALQVQSHIYTILIEFARKTEKDMIISKENRTNTDFSFYHILEYIDTHSGEPLEIHELAEMCHMSYSHFAKLFRENYGRSCKEYITYIRLNKAQDLLFHTDYDLNFIAQETGFFDCSHFIRIYKKWKGITPKQERLKLI